jgi:hypothetical protein
MPRSSRESFKAEGLSPSTIQGNERNIRSFGTFLFEEGDTEENIFEGLKPPRFPKKIILRWEEASGASIQRINKIVRGKRGIFPETALQLLHAFGNIPDFWMNLRTVYDLASSQPKWQKIVPLVINVNS